VLQDPAGKLLARTQRRKQSNLPTDEALQQTARCAPRRRKETVMVMPIRALVVLALLTLGGCAGLPQKEPLQVTVAGIEPLQGEGLELRMLVRLRVQNPNDAPFEFDGVSVTLDVQGKTFATGVAGESGVVPRFGETVVAVPVTVSVLRMVRQVMGVLDGKPVESIRYDLSGKLSGTGFSAARFQAQGELELPKSAPAPAQ
jgi:LEA14-like dessication related protein